MFSKSSFLVLAMVLVTILMIGLNLVITNFSMILGEGLLLCAGDFACYTMVFSCFVLCFFFNFIAV